MYNKLLAVEDNTFLVTYSSSEFSEEGERTINECFREEIAKADKVEISVAYCGYNSLKEIDRLVEKGNIKYICVILGMHWFIGLWEDLYLLAIEINEKWRSKGMGEIRLVDYFPHHDKLYCFYKNDHLFSAIIGSPNLSFLITQERKTSRQYELGELIHKPSSLRRYRRHIAKLKSNNFSKNIVDLEQYKSVVVEEELNRWGKIIQKTKITYTKKLFSWW
ncbi:restriction endonuclease PLD domain-containing protein [Mycoplasma wenyonii]|uniref:restriction endonuclease PLD domain-containing protein n=1 Tax=Mycoplasma wenyonii TaxID=65123 RepID=UPI000313C748|nr:restriction endonuclease PLD domain-containing protein [Mycoplasma wenyonii]